MNTKEKKAWVANLRVGDMVVDCKGRSIRIKEKSEGEGYDVQLVLADGSCCSAMNCCVPVDSEDAVRILRRLRGHTHQVYSAIALLRVEDGKLLTDLCVTEVPMRAYRDEEITAYVDSQDP